MISQDKIRQFLDKIDPKIMARGVEYYHRRRVSCTERTASYVRSEVSGSGPNPYEVNLYFNVYSGALEEWTCDCPYDQGDVCKHVAATLLYVTKTPEEPLPHTPEKPELQKLVEGAEKAQLAALILEHCQEDIGFRNQVISKLGSGEPELKAIQARVKAAVRANEWNGFIDMDGCDKICAELDKALEKARRRLHLEQYGQALEIARFVLLTGVELGGNADSSSGALSHSVGTALLTVSRAANGLAESGADREKWAEKLLNTAQSPVFNGWLDCCYDFLEQITVLSDPQTEGLFLAALNHLRDRHQKKFSDNSWYAQRDITLRYHVMRAAYGAKEARHYLKQHLDVDALRHILVQEEIQAGNYAEAELLCREAAEATENPLLSSPWHTLLYSIYEAQGEREKQIREARILALTGDKKFYDTLKRLLTEEGRWQESRLDFLAAFKTARPPHDYMTRLAQERETALLMEEVRLQPRAVFRYGGLLAPVYGAEIYGLCSAEILRQAKAAADRKAYQGLCGLICTLAEWGGRGEAGALIQELRKIYPQRPALWDELKKTERWIAALPEGR